MFTDGSDYIVEQYIKPTKVRKRIINDERADLLGNFDDDDTKFMKKKTKTPKPTVFASEEDPFADAADESEHEQIRDENDENDLSTADNDSDSSSNGDGDATLEESDNKTVANANVDTDEADVDEVAPQSGASKTKKSNRKPEKAPKNPQKSFSLTDDQIKALIRGSSKQDRFVLYVTNLNYSTTREALTQFFEAAGTVKSVRVPKVRRSAFAFVEMSDIDGFKVRLFFRINVCRATDFVHAIDLKEQHNDFLLL